METQVGIIGAGPAGLMLAHLLAGAGIESVVLEDRSRAHVEQRIRAGVLEQPTVDLLDQLGVGERMHREGLVHHGIEIRFDGQRHRIALSDLTGGKAITIYGQQELVKDLIAVRLAAGAPILFDVEDVRFDGLDTTRPTVSFRDHGRDETLRCAYVAGCDGFHGVSRPTIPDGVLRTYERDYPFAWLGILAQVAPSTDELIYASHERGFALHSLRSPSISRLYLQVAPDEDLAAWSDDRIWSELRTRLASNGWSLADGPIVDRGITPLRSFVVEPMQYGRLFLAGDAAHIVPATGAKGLNLAVSDVRALAEAIVRAERQGDARGLTGYTERCLRRIWRVQDFSWWMSAMLHRLPDEDGFAGRLRRAQLEWLVASEAASRGLAENYVGLPFA